MKDTWRNKLGGRKNTKVDEARGRLNKTNKRRVHKQHHTRIASIALVRSRRGCVHDFCEVKLLANVCQMFHLITN